MKCLFVRPPFAGWIVDGVKTIEYRSKASNIRGRVGIIQSMSGTVIGDVEIVGCNWNEKIQRYEWSLANARRYKHPLAFQQKSGAVVWMGVDYDPNAQEVAPALSTATMRQEKITYEKEIAFFLNSTK